MSVNSAEAICTALKGKWSSQTSKGMCKCPAHADLSPSLSVGVGDKGKVLIHCFSGCDAAEVINALKELNLWPKSRRNRKHRISNISNNITSIKPRLTEHDYAFGLNWHKDKEIRRELERLFLMLPDDADYAWLEIEENWIYEKILEKMVEEYEEMFCFDHYDLYGGVGIHDCS